MDSCDQQPGKVIATRPGEVAVLTEARGGCGRCQSPGGCGRPMDERPTTTWLANTDGFQVGEEVTLLVETPALERAAWAAYGAPLMGLLLGAWSGQTWGDLGALLGAVVGLGSGLYWVRWRSANLSPHLWLERRNQS